MWTFIVLIHTYTRQTNRVSLTAGIRVSFGTQILINICLRAGIGVGIGPTVALAAAVAGPTAAVALAMPIGFGVVVVVVGGGGGGGGGGAAAAVAATPTLLLCAAAAVAPIVRDAEDTIAGNDEAAIVDAADSASAFAVAVAADESSRVSDGLPFRSAAISPSPLLETRRSS
jgi:hypothetical protein